MSTFFDIPSNAEHVTEESNHEYQIRNLESKYWVTQNHVNRLVSFHSTRIPNMEMYRTELRGWKRTNRVTSCSGDRKVSVFKLPNDILYNLYISYIFTCIEVKASWRDEIFLFLSSWMFLNVQLDFTQNTFKFICYVYSSFFIKRSIQWNSWNVR